MADIADRAAIAVETTKADGWAKLCAQPEARPQ